MPGRSLLKYMRFVVRLLGTWLLGLALILLIVDGTKSLGASALMLTSVGDMWSLIHLSSLQGFEQFVSQGAVSVLWSVAVLPVLSWPGWAICGVPGLVFAYLGRSRGNQTRNFNQV